MVPRRQLSRDRLAVCQTRAVLSPPFASASVVALRPRLNTCQGFSNSICAPPFSPLLPMEGPLCLKRFVSQRGLVSYPSSCFSLLPSSLQIRRTDFVPFLMGMAWVQSSGPQNASVGFHPEGQEVLPGSAGAQRRAGKQYSTVLVLE